MAVYHRPPTTPPDALVLHLLRVKTFAGSEATEWGKWNEEHALKTVCTPSTKCWSRSLTTCQSGFVHESHPFLLNVPISAAMYLLFKHALKQFFFCSPNSSGENLVLKRNHNYYCQIQGQMGRTGRFGVIL